MNNARVVNIDKLTSLYGNKDSIALCAWGDRGEDKDFIATVPVGYEENMLGVFFPVGGTLSGDFVDYNLLTPPYATILRASLNERNEIISTPIWISEDKIYYSDGIFLPLSCLYAVKANLTELREGDIVNEIRGVRVYSPEKDT